jgi:hypothetical protein
MVDECRADNQLEDAAEKQIQFRSANHDHGDKDNHMLDSMQRIGRVKLVQVQRASLKVGHLYDPAPLAEVAYLRLTPEGVIGVAANGEEIVDVHNARHERSRNSGRNAFSFGFTAHYAQMRERFGEHLRDGIAGENIIIECDLPFSVDDLGRQIAFQNPETGGTIILEQPRTMAPCEQFSRYAAGKPDLGGAEMKMTLQFLSDGRRGFCATPIDFEGELTVRAGDLFFVSGTE